MRLRMSACPPSYMEPFRLGEPLVGHGVAEVIRGGSAALPTGSLVTGLLPWAEYAYSSSRHLRPVPVGDFSDAQLLGVLGMPGLTAFVGLFRFGRPRSGESILVSSAAGTVGLVAGQLARHHGCRVVGITRSRWKLPLLQQAGFHDAIVYSGARDLSDNLPRVAPDGLDIAFDNVGGHVLDTAIDNMKPGGRIVSCGAISTYNQRGRRRGPPALGRLLERGIRLEGFNVEDHALELERFEREVAHWLSSGVLQVPSSRVEGLANASVVFRGLFNGSFAGKVTLGVRGIGGRRP